MRFGNTLLFSNEDLYPEYWKRWISKREAFVGLMGLLEKTDGLLDSTLLALFYEDGYDYLLFLSLLFFILKSLRKLGLSLVYSKMRVSLSGKEEVSLHLQSTWKYFLNSGFLITESYINRFSPSDSIHVRISEKIQFQMNFKTALNFYQLIFETLPFLFLYITYLSILKYDKAESRFQIFPVVYGTVKNMILSIFQFMSFLLYKPSQIGQNHFDEAFTSLQYRKALQQIGEAGESVKYSANLLSHQKPAKFTNLRSLLNGNRFRDQVILKDKQFIFSQRTPQFNMFDDADTDKYSSLPGNNSYHRATLSKNRNEEDSFHEKYQEGFVKKNKHCFQADRHRKNTQSNNNNDKLQDISQDHCEDRDLIGEQHKLNENYDENISILPHSRKHLHPYSPVEKELSLSNIVVDEQQQTANLPNSIFNHPNFPNSLAALNLKHCSF